MSEVINEESEDFKELIRQIKRTERSICDAIKRMRPTIVDEHYMTREEVCTRLGISRRTLQTLRDRSKVPYTTIGNKILYPESGLYDVLKKNYRDFRLWRQR